MAQQAMDFNMHDIIEVRYQTTTITGKDGPFVVLRICAEDIDGNRVTIKLYQHEDHKIKMRKVAGKVGLHQ